MTESGFTEGNETRTIEVRAFRHGALIHQELCESEEQATSIADEWSEFGDVSCEIDDLSIHHQPGDILEPEPAVVDDDDYAARVEVDIGARSYD